MTEVLPSGEVVCVYRCVCIYTHTCVHIYTTCVLYTQFVHNFLCCIYNFTHTQIVLNGLKDKPWYYKGEWQVDWLWIVQSEKTTFKLRWCQRVNVIFPSPQCMLKPGVECDGVWSEAFGRWLGLGPWEWSTHEWDLGPYKRDPRERPCPFHRVRTSCEHDPPWVRNWVLIRRQILQHFDLGLPASRTIWNKLLFLSPSVYGRLL